LRPTAVVVVNVAHSAFSLSKEEEEEEEEEERYSQKTNNTSINHRVVLQSEHTRKVYKN
jgi:hypothetical protein